MGSSSLGTDEAAYQLDPVAGGRPRLGAGRPRRRAPPGGGAGLQGGRRRGVGGQPQVPARVRCWRPPGRRVPAPAAGDLPAGEAGHILQSSESRVLQF